MSDSAAIGAPNGPGSPGRLLAAARQARGLTVTEVALRLKFAPRQIEALEADRHEALPGAAVVRGMIRAYAKLLAIDPGPLLAALQEQRRAGPETVTMQPRAMAVPMPRAAPRGSLVYLVLSAFVVIAVASVIADWLFRPRDPAAPAARPVAAGRDQAVVAATGAPALPAAAAAVEPAPAAAAPAPVATPAPAGAPPRPSTFQHETILHAKRIELVFDRESWVEIKDADGRIVFSQLNPPGSRRNVVGEAPFSIVIGNARGVKLRYNNTDVDLAPFTRTDVARLTLE
jgi:cytoskeleton protein RodZ